MLFTKLDILSCLLNLTICAQFTTSLKKKILFSFCWGIISYVFSKPRTGHKCVSGKPRGCSLLTQISNNTNVTIQHYKSFF